jgi:predicted amidohydrolase YtcJ
MRSSATIVRTVITALVAAVLGWTAVLAQQPQQPADLIVTNAKVITVDPQRPQATAFAVKDGTFVAVGDDADVAPHRGEKTRVIDAKGHTVIPGLNDSHAHVVRGGRFYTLELRWDGVESLQRGFP